MFEMGHQHRSPDDYNHGLRDALDLDIGMNEVVVPAADLKDPARRRRPGQDHDLRAAGGGRGIRPLPRGGLATVTPTAPCRASTPGAGPISPAARHAIPTPATARRGRSMSPTWSGCWTSSRPPSPLIPASVARPAKRRPPHGVIYFLVRPPRAHDHRAIRPRPGFASTPAPARLPSTATPVARNSSSAHGTVFVVEQNRDGQVRTLLMNELGVDPAKLVAVLNYDGSPSHRPVHATEGNQRAG